MSDECPVNNLEKLEGESIAEVWVLKKLSGKGEGSSELHYAGSHVINYITNGTPIITKL